MRERQGVVRGSESARARSSEKGVRGGQGREEGQGDGGVGGGGGGLGRGQDRERPNSCIHPARRRAAAPCSDTIFSPPVLWGLRVWV